MMFRPRWPANGLRTKKPTFMPNPSLPATLLPDLAWSFTGTRFADVQAFSEEVRQYQIDIIGEDSWNPGQVVLPLARVLVAYECWKGDEQATLTVELASVGGQHFTALGLMFQLHNAVVEDLRDIDHHFFEGLGLNSLPVAGLPPLYLLHQGS
jgi:hypothetical protein